MAILREREVWRRPRPAATRKTLSLTAEERGHVRAALRFMRQRYGNATTLAVKLGVQMPLIAKAVSKNGKPTAMLAILLARLAGVPLEDVLTGVFPDASACPTCGRS